MSEEPIRLADYDQHWPLRFESEKHLIEETLGTWIVGGVEHVGSTSIPGLIAKPTIDIMIGVEDLEAAQACIPLMERMGYVYSPYRADIMHWFCKPSFEKREYHAYLMEYGSHEWKLRVAFRDHLRTHPAVADAYVALKKDLAARFHDDREAYTDGKAAFIERISHEALGA
jgi:GrpB-like predicted nucleotidyltransferase (UPF0157 family)